MSHATILVENSTIEVDLVGPGGAIALAAAARAEAAADEAEVDAASAAAAAAAALLSETNAGAYLDGVEDLVAGIPLDPTLPLQAVSRTILAGFTGMSAGRQAFLSEAGREGLFVWSTANNSANVTADPLQGIYVAPTSDTDGSSGAWVRRFHDGVASASWWGMSEALSDQSPALQAALDAAGVSVVSVAGGDFWIGEPILSPDGKRLVGAGMDATWFHLLPAMSGVSAEHVFSCGVDAVGCGWSDFSVHGEYVGEGGGAGTRTHIIVARGKTFLVENISVKNAWGYAFWGVGEDLTNRASGIFRNVHVDNANVHFETTNADDITFDGFTGISGDEAALDYVALGNEGIHPIAGSKNITYRNGRLSGTSGAWISISPSGIEDQTGIVLENIKVELDDDTFQGGVIAGSGGFRNTVTFINVDITKPINGEAALSVTDSDLFVHGGKFEGGAIAVSAGTGGNVWGFGSQAIGETTPATSTAYGLFASGTGTIRWVAGSVKAFGTPSTTPYAGDVTLTGGPVLDPEGGDSINVDGNVEGGTLRATGYVNSGDDPALELGYATGSSRTFHQSFNRGTNALLGHDVYTLEGSFYSGATPGAAVNIWGYDSTGLKLASGKVMKVNSVQVVGARDTGWTAMTGTGSKGALAAAAAGTASVGYVQAELQAALNRIAALEAKLRSHDAAMFTHGLIGT